MSTTIPKPLDQANMNLGETPAGEIVIHHDHVQVDHDSSELGLQPTKSIASCYQTCVQGFLKLNDALCSIDESAVNVLLSSPEPESACTKQPQQTQRAMRDELGRFKMWAGNSGAHHKAASKMSLDYRLRESLHIHRQVVRLLEDLECSLGQAQTIINSTNAVKPHADEAMEDRPALFAIDNIDSSSDSSSDLELEETLPSTTEFEYAILRISHIIKCLYRFSTVMHQPVPVQRIEKCVSINVKHYEFWDLQHAINKFPAAPKYLQQRLGRANSKRRQLLIYQERHRRKITQFVEDPVAALAPEPSIPGIESNVEDQSIQQQIVDNPAAVLEIECSFAGFTNPSTVLSTTTATDWLEKNNNIDLKDLQLPEESGDERSVTSYSSSYASTTCHISVPDLQDLGEQGFDYNVPFQCPYCHDIISIKSSKGWKRHVFADLMPYVCTFEDCLQPDHIYSSRQEWFDHELQVHRREWNCRNCQLIFSTKETMIQHLRNNHRNESEFRGLGLDFSSIAESCGRAKTANQSCPLCPQNFLPDQKHLQRHHRMKLGDPVDFSIEAERLLANDPPSCPHCPVMYEPYQLMRHIGHHLQQLALFTLPRPTKDDSNDDKESLSGKAWRDESEILSEQSPSVSQNEFGTDSASDNASVTHTEAPLTTTGAYADRDDIRSIEDTGDFTISESGQHLEQPGSVARGGPPSGNPNVTESAANLMEEKTLELKAIEAVLALFPLCIELVILHRSGVGTIRAMRHHQQALRLFQHQLQMEYTRFLTSLHEIFDDEIIEQDCIWIFRDPIGNEAQERLEARLSRPNAVESFIDAILDLRDELDELKNTLPTPTLDSTSDSLITTILQNKNIVADMTAVEHIKYVQAQGKNKMTLVQVGKSMKKRFKFAVLQQELSKQMQKIREINEGIHTLTGGKRWPATNRSTDHLTNRRSFSSKEKHLKIQNYYQRVREGAQSICKSIQTRILTPHSCMDYVHNVGLCLELRDPALIGEALPNPQLSALCFKIVLSLKPDPEHPSITHWKELEIEPIAIEDVDETKRQQADNIHDDKLIPEVHVDTKGNANLEHPSGNVKTKNTPIHDQLGQASASGQRPTTPTKKARPLNPVNKIARFLGLDERSTPHPESTTTPTASTSHPASGVLTPEPSVRSVNRAIHSTYSLSDIETHMISDICSTIKKSTAVTRSFLGFLKVDTFKSTDMVPVHRYRYHRVWSMPYGGCFDIAHQLNSSGTWNFDPVSLGALLLTSQHRIQLKDRLLLGLTLAASVIQLHNTSWLNEMWTKDNIVFFIDPQTNNPLLKTPLLPQKLTIKPPHPTIENLPHHLKSKPLFSLGILLCELWFWQRLEDVIKLDVSDNHMSEWSDIVLLAAGNQALERMGPDAPSVYCEAVRTCLFSDIPTEGRDFVSFVWEKVLSRLKEVLSVFLGER